jgi:hypothetical protein
MATEFTKDTQIQDVGGSGRLDPQERRAMRVLVVSSVVSKVADYGLTLVAPLAVLSTTGSVAASILTIALRGVAYAVSPVIGVLIDRFERRGLYVASQLQQAACVGIAAAFLDRPWVVATMLLLSGLGGVAASISSQFVLIPELVRAEHREVSVARLASSIEYAKVGGFLLSGSVFTLAGAPAATWLVGILYAAAGAVCMRLRRVPVANEPDTLRAGLVVGFRWLKRRDIGFLVASMAVSNLALGSLGSVLVTLLGDQGMEPVAISATLAVGLMLGAVGSRLAPQVVPAWSLQARILVFQLLVAASFVLIVLETSRATTIVAWTVMSAGFGLSNVVSITFRQGAIPVHLSGRVNSVIRMFIAGAIPLSGMTFALAEAQGWWLWGPAVALEGLSIAIWVAYMALPTSAKEQASSA